MAGTLTSTTSISIADNSTGETYAITANYNKSSLAIYDRRYLQVGTTAKDIIGIDPSGIGKGTITGLTSFILINRGSGDLTIGLKSASDTVYYTVGTFVPFVLFSTKIDANTTGAVYSAYVDITSISVAAQSGTCDVEYLITHTTV